MTTPVNLDDDYAGNDDRGDVVRMLSHAQLGHADLIAAHHHASLALEALTRAVRAYSRDGSPNYALVRVRARAALARIEKALPFIDADGGAKYD